MMGKPLALDFHRLRGRGERYWTVRWLSAIVPPLAGLVTPPVLGHVDVIFSPAKTAAAARCSGA